jgi:hypothetical protein
VSRFSGGVTPHRFLVTVELPETIDPATVAAIPSELVAQANEDPTLGERFRSAAIFEDGPSEQGAGDFAPRTQRLSERVTVNLRDTGAAAM